MCCLLFVHAVIHPSTSYAEWIGPLYEHNVMYISTGPYTDFYFICRIDYTTQSVMDDDGARFEVVLTFDSQLIFSITKTTTSKALDVYFTSKDVRNGFGSKVSGVSFAALTVTISVLCSIVDYNIHWLARTATVQSFFLLQTSV